MNLKRKIALNIQKKPLLKTLDNLLIRINQSLYHRDMKQKEIHPGVEDPEKKYVVIRPSGRSEGLISSYFTVTEQVLWCYKQGYIPYIDFENKNCQYFTGRNINGTVNAWEYYFNQPEKMTKEEVLSKKNVFLSGWSWKDKGCQHIDRNLSLLKNDELKNVCLMRLGVNTYVQQELEKRFTNLQFSDNTLGVFIRGTDYIALKPKGHPVQPSIKAVIDKINEFKVRHNLENIYVVTEDLSYFNKLKDLYGKTVFSADDNFVDNYDSSDLIESSFDNDPYERGLNYIIRLLLLGKCQYLISSVTNGSLFARMEKHENYEDEFWFDLGEY